VRSAQSPEDLVGLREHTPEPYQLQMHRRFALPVAPIVFALVGVPLGQRRVRGARSFGAMLCVALAFAYYMLLSFAEFLGTDAGVPPAAAMWLPNVVFLALAIPLPPPDTVETVS
jgi:lipopolysaccharide export LptBFGC system permease protein LptF